MSESVNPHDILNKEELEYFIVFRFPHRLGAGIKSRLKSFGCSWNSLLHGWVCPLYQEKEIRHAIHQGNLECNTQVVSLPKGMIPSNPKIASRATQLDILQIKYHKADMALLRDVYQYDPSLRPDDFSDQPSSKEKTPENQRREQDFHERWLELQKMKTDIENAEKELSHLKADSGNKTFDPKAPLPIAEALIHGHYLHQGLRTLHYCADSFLEWSGIKYIEVSEMKLRQIVYNFLRDAKKINNKGHLENFNPDLNKVNQVIDALRAICHQNGQPAGGPFWLDDHRDINPRQLIAFQNGLLNLEEWLTNPSSPLLAHTPSLMNINALNFDYNAAVYEPQEWLCFLNSIWKEDLQSQDTLQEWVGYLLTQDTSQHKILLLIGPPRSGKGTIGRVLHELLGTFNVAGPTLSSLGGEFGLQPLINKMLATISDARLNGRGNNSLITERLLSISGEDPLTINRKFLAPLTIQLPTRLMIMTNELPDIQDSSGALAKRYLILTLQKSWYGHEDTSLLNRLRAELPGILLWALEGLARLQSRGKFLQPASALQTIAELEAMTSPIRAFVAEMCELKPYARTSIAALFHTWRSWGETAGYRQTGNVQTFGKNLRAAYPEIEITRPQGGGSRERYYQGIALISSHTTSADMRGPEWEHP